MQRRRTRHRGRPARDGVRAALHRARHAGPVGRHRPRARDRARARRRDGRIGTRRSAPRRQHPVRRLAPDADSLSVERGLDRVDALDSRPHRDVRPRPARLSWRSIASATSPAELVTSPTALPSERDLSARASSPVGRAQAAQLAVDVTAGVDAAHELLPEEAALRERHRVAARGPPLAGSCGRRCRTPGAARRPRCAHARSRRRRASGTIERRRRARRSPSAVPSASNASASSHATSTSANIGRAAGRSTAHRERARRRFVDVDLHADLEPSQSVGERRAEPAFAHAPPLSSSLRAA